MWQRPWEGGREASGGGAGVGRRVPPSAETLLLWRGRRQSRVRRARRHVVVLPGPPLPPPRSWAPCAWSARPAGFLPLAEGAGGGACS